MTHQSVNRTLDTACYRLSREVREHPLLSVGVAVGVGALLGSIARQAAVAAPGGHKKWLADLTSDLSDHAHHAGNRALRAKRQATRGLHVAANRATDALPEVDIDHLVNRGRDWLRSILA